MGVHEWSTNYAIISVEVDEIKVDLVFYPTDINGHLSPMGSIFWIGSRHSPVVGSLLILQSDLLCSGGESKLWREGVCCAP